MADDERTPLRTSGGGAAAVPQRGACADLASELAREKLPLRDFDEAVAWAPAFGTSRDPALTPRYAQFRLALAVLTSAIFIWALANDFVTCGNSDGKFLIHLTYWTLLMQFLYAWLAWYTTHRAAQLITVVGRPAGGGGSLLVAASAGAGPWYVRATWLLQSIVVNGAFFVFVLFWLLVAPFKKDPIGPLSYFTHGVNFALVVADVAASNTPFYFAHSLYYFAYAAAYLLFSLLYYEAGGTDCKGNPYVYSVLDWRKPGAAATTSLGVLLVFVPIVLVPLWFMATRCFAGPYRRGPRVEVGQV